MALHRLSRIEIGVPGSALDACRAYYRELGLREESPGRFGTVDGGEQLALVATRQRALVALAVGVDDADDLGRAAAGLAKLGVETKHDGRTLEAREPATGLRVELIVEARSRQAPRPAVLPNGPGRTARRNERAPAVGLDMPPRPRKLSHVVTTSTDPAATRRFFTEGIGFAVSDEIAGLGASFMRCSTDHHNLLVQPGPFATLHHVAWEMDDVDAIGRLAGELLKADPARHVWGLGRHGIGSNCFWYLRDPAGNYVELSSDLDVIDDAEAWRAATAAAKAAPAALAVWGPPVPPEFLAPVDVVARMQERAQAS